LSQTQLCFSKLLTGEILAKLPIKSTENPIITTIPDVKAIKRSLLDNMKADNENIKKLTLSAEKGNAIAQRQNLSFMAVYIY
jgi:hypothetical protein